MTMANETTHTPGAAASDDSPTARTLADPIRSSILLVTGRVLSIGLTYLVQVLVVRFLTKTDYGAWTYALSVITVLQVVAALGLDNVITRFVSIYREQGDFGRLAGAIGLMTGCVVVTSAVLITVFLSFSQRIGDLFHIGPEPLRVLSVLILLVPLESLDSLVIGLFACLGHARAIFTRRYVLAPALRLAAALALVAGGADVVFLAWGYVAASLAGLAVYGVPLLRACHRDGLLTNIRNARLVVPAREVFGFALPLLAADLSTAVMESTGALVLGYFWSLNEVAVFSAAVSLATMNRLVMRSFGLLYTPAAARLFARGCHASINDLYWRTAAWIAVLTFPIFALTFSAAGAVTTILYGDRYRDAAAILALLALGQYVNSALGFNGLTLRILDKVGYVVRINLIAAVLSVVANVLLIPHFGAIGGAVATSGSMVAHNLFKQAGLRLATGIDWFDARYLQVYITIVVCGGGLAAGQMLLGGQPMLMVALASLVSLALVALSRRALQVSETFPEILRVPFLRVLFT